MQSPEPEQSKPPRLSLTWEYCHNACNELVRVMKRRGYTPLDIIAVARGGVIPAALIHQAFPTAKLHVIRSRLYTEFGKLPEPLWDYHNNAEVLMLQNALVVDEIVDSGDTFRALKKLLPPTTRFATMTQRATVKDIFTTDYVGAWISCDRWVDFPWENNHDRN